MPAKRGVPSKCPVCGSRKLRAATSPKLVLTIASVTVTALACDRGHLFMVPARDAASAASR